MVRYNNTPRDINIECMLRTFDNLNQHMKRQIICDTIFIEYQGEVDLETNLVDLYPYAYSW